MNPKQLIGGILIILAIVLAYDGIKKFDNSTADVKFLGIHINASDSMAKSATTFRITGRSTRDRWKARRLVV